MSKELTEYEKKFVKAICEYSQQSYLCTSKEQISRDDPDKREKLHSLHEARNKTQEIINALGNMVNSFGFDCTAVLEEIKKDKNGYTNLVALSYEWVEVLGSGTINTDERNQKSVELCKEIWERLDHQYGVDITADELAPYYCELEQAVRGMHRTLMQTSTNMFTKVLRETDKVVNKYLTEKYGEKDIRLPMI